MNELQRAVQDVEDKIYDLADKSISIEFIFTGVTNEGEPEIDVEIRGLPDYNWLSQVVLDSFEGCESFEDAIKKASQRVLEWLNEKD